MNEIKKQIERINAQIETERRIYEAWKKFKDCEIKTVVIHQTVGVIRGLEAGKEALEYLLGKENDVQMSTDEWSKIDDGMAGRL